MHEVSSTQQSDVELQLASTQASLETLDRPSSTQSAHSAHSAHSSMHDTSLHTSQLQRPPSTHANERPTSNQSANSVHSLNSVHSNRSSLPVHPNQEEPLEENLQMPTPETSSSQAVLQEPNTNLPDTSNVTKNSFEPLDDNGIDPTAPPTGLPIGPPPVSGPFGAMPNLRARKGSPFQPPSMKRGVGVPAAVQVQNKPVSQSSSTDSVLTDPLATVNADALPDNNENPNGTEKSGVPLWSNTEDVPMNVKLAVAAPAVTETVPNPQPMVPSNSIPLVVPGMVKEEITEADEPPVAHSNFEQPPWVTPEPPAAHNAHFLPPTVKPKVQSLCNMPTDPSSPAVLDLSRPSRSGTEPRGDGSQDKTETPNFSRMVPGESSKDALATSAPAYQAPVVVPSMPSERVVTGNDNPQPVLPVRIKQEPSEVRSPPDGPDTSDPLNQGASVVPPVRSETIGSEEPTARNFTSNNSGSRPDLTNDHRNERSGRWERDHSRERDSRSSDRYRERSHERNRDYYRDDSPHSRRSYDRDYDRKYDDDRRWRRRESDEEEDNDRRYYETRDRRERAYRDELDRYSDRPIKEEKDRAHRESRDSREKRRGYRDRSKDYYHSYDDDPYYGRSDR